MLLDKRINYKPFEYPEVMTFVDKMNQTFWVHNEVDFTADIQDYKANLTDIERSIVRKSLLAISQVEVAVKSFWGDLYRHIPKPEFNCLGMTLGESEVRHSEAYSRLIDVLHLTDEYEKILQVPVFRKKIEMLDEHYVGQDFVRQLIFFTIVIENSSLFSQFANVIALSTFKGLMKNITNMINWTVVDEDSHADTGVYIVNLFRREYPHMLPSQQEIDERVKAYISYEEELLGWIYEDGEFPWFSKKDMINFMKYRVDLALTKVGYTKVFNITDAEYKPMYWFDEAVYSNSNPDFFATRPTDYSKHNKAFTADALF